MTSNGADRTTISPDCTNTLGVVEMRKDDMTHSRTRPSIFVLAAAMVVGSAASESHGEERRPVMRIADRCDVYGPGFVDMGGGTCGRVVSDGRVRIEVPAHAPSVWTGGQTSHAALRDGSAGMLPGPANVQHLRIQADPFDR